MITTTCRAKAPLAIGTLAIAVALGMAGFNAATAADTRHHYERGQNNYSSGKSRTYKSSRKANSHQVHKRAQEKTRYGNAPKHAKQVLGGKRHAYTKPTRKYHSGPKHGRGPAYKYKGGKTYAYKRPIRKYHSVPKHGRGTVYKHNGGYRKPHGRIYVAGSIVRYGWAPYQPTRYYYSRHGCHAVSKKGYTRNGRKVKFGGTMCYDNYGYGYIVNGSRHIIHYY